MQNLLKLDMENKKFYKTLITLCIPIIIQNLLSNLINMIDTVMVGGLGEVSVASIGIANQYFFLYNINYISDIRSFSIQKIKSNFNYMLIRNTRNSLRIHIINYNKTS